MAADPLAGEIPPSSLQLAIVATTSQAPRAGSPAIGGSGEVSSWAFGKIVDEFKKDPNNPYVNYTSTSLATSELVVRRVWPVVSCVYMCVLLFVLMGSRRQGI
jgi:hypothetical protein